MSRINLPVFLIAWLLACFLSWQHVSQSSAWSPIFWTKIESSSSTIPLYDEQLIPNAGQHSTHSVSTTTLPSGNLVAFWFAGSREGGKDVQIFQSYFQQTQQQWTEPQGIVNVPQLGKDLGRYISKIGNPLVYVDKKQRMWLFFVTVSYGGWAGSSLNLMFSDDLGKSWGKPKRLITSPFINISTLVRNSMNELEDGSVVLPVYHEFIAQFPELLRVSAEGEVLSKTRMSGANGGIQPSMVQGDNDELYAFMRIGSHASQHQVLRLSSQDDGQHWSGLTSTNLPNPNAAQIVVKAGEKLWLWIGNHNAKDRSDLTLAISHDFKGDWKSVYQFEKGADGDAYSYPVITQGKDGVWHLMYTYKRKNIKHIRFNQAWLDNQIKASEQAQKL
ncbi:MAG: sialidase family protein [Ghiorsea sp.]